MICHNHEYKSHEPKIVTHSYLDEEFIPKVKEKHLVVFSQM